MSRYRYVSRCWTSRGKLLRGTTLVILTLIVATRCMAAEGTVETTTDESLWGAISGLLQSDLLLCFLIIGLGMGLGSIRLLGITLGSSGVLFVAILFGHLGRNAGWSLPDGMGRVGLVLFVYAVGLGAGPTFFRAFRAQGKRLAVMGVVTVGIGAAMAIALGWYFKMPSGLTAGIFSGAMTSTPALAAGIQAAGKGGLDGSAVSIGYGMGYPIGVVVVVLFVQLLPRLLRVNLDRLGDKLQKERERSRENGLALVVTAK